MDDARQHVRGIAEVELAEPRPGGEFVAEDFGDQMRVGRAADVPQQRQVIGFGCSAFVEAGSLRQPHGEDRGS